MYRTPITLSPPKKRPYRTPFALYQGGGLSQVKLSSERYRTIPLYCNYRGFAKGWFPKGWFWRMFPRNENRNEGTFAKTTLLETALLSPNDPFLVLTKGWFPKGWFRRMFPGTKTGTRVRSPKPPFYETALLSPSETIGFYFSGGNVNPWGTTFACHPG